MLARLQAPVLPETPLDIPFSLSDFFLRFLFGFQLERLRFCSRYEKTIRLEELRGVSFENLPLAGKKVLKEEEKA